MKAYLNDNIKPYMNLFSILKYRITEIAGLDL